MRWPMGLVVLAVLAGACGDSGDASLPDPTAAPPSVESTTTQPTPTTPPAVTATTATTQPPTTETVDPPPNAAPAFTLTQVVFGDSAFVQITNTGNGPGDLEGHWLCQRPAYFEIPSVELGPGQSVWVAADGSDLQFVGNVVGVIDVKGRLGSLVAATGEVALYRDNDFGSPESIVDYVEWGSTGHGRSSVAVSAGQWPADGFVVIPEGTIAITAPAGGDDPASWAPDIGV